MPEKKYINSIKQNNEKYLLKDNEARDNIGTLKENDLRCRAIGDETVEFYFGAYRPSTSTNEDLQTNNGLNLLTSED